MFKVWVLKKYSFEKEHAGDKQTTIWLKIDTKRWALPFSVTWGENHITWAYEIAFYFLCFGVKFAFFH